MQKPLVGIVMGSDSDLSVMSGCAKMLEAFDVPYEMLISSAHRSPEKTLAYARTAASRGIEILIAGAGKAAHLGGVIASETPLPVIGIPMKTSDLGGVDSLYSMVQMPGGIPVATVTIGAAGAKNAAILAVQMLGIKYPELRRKMINYKEKMKQDILEKNERLQSIGYEKYLEEMNQ